MHPAPSLAEAFPKSEDPRPAAQQQIQQQPGPESVAQPPQAQQQQDEGRHALENHSLTPPAFSPQPVRKDTTSSISTNATDATAVTNASTDTAYSVESSQSIFSAKDGVEVSTSRRASRRRTGPLSAQQREKAALIRKLGACPDCRRRRVACHPNHHNMTWEDAVRKYRSHSPMQELAPLAGRPLSPAPKNGRRGFTHDTQEMDLDSVPTPPGPQTTPGRTPFGDSRIRTPLPSGPRLDKPMSMPPLAAAPPPPTTLPNIDSIRSELDTAASRILSGPHRGRYNAVLALLICWQDDEDPGVVSSVEELGAVFDKYFHYTFEIIKIPTSSSDGCKNSSRWLSRVLNDFTDNSDTRDVLKIVYYNGWSYLDQNGELILASSHDRERACTIRWNGIQQMLEEACSDTCIILDTAYYPSPKLTRQKGVLELISASSSEEGFALVGRNTFTRALAEQLRARFAQGATTALSVAELHSRLLSVYPKMVSSRHPERQHTTDFPTPLYMQVSGNPRLPSITLSPAQSAQPKSSIYSPGDYNGPQLTLSFRLTDESLNMESWIEWLRMMPDGIKDVKVEGPYARTFR